MYTDSHFHVDHFVLKDTVPEMMTAAEELRVGTLIAIGGSDGANQRALDTAHAFPGRVFATAGYDRDVANDWDQDTSRLRPFLDMPEIVAVGECGLDYFHKENDPMAQKVLFDANLALSTEYNKPVIIHSREADADTLDILRTFSGNWPIPERPCGVLHCFTGSIDFAKALLDLNLMISFSGIVSFKNAADLREVAAMIPDDRLLIETDSPYLAPVPHRGQRNQPAWVIHVAECLAGVRQTTPEAIGELTSANARRFFNLP
jgi:TatD DNase family protein